MRTIAFRKMHGLGNDFVVLDRRHGDIALGADAARALADRHSGIGCDQLLVLEPAQMPSADFRMRIFNIGAEGQLYMGAILGSGAGLWLGGGGGASPFVIAAMIVAGCAGGARLALGRVSPGRPGEAARGLRRCSSRLPGRLPDRG